MGEEKTKHASEVHMCMDKKKAMRKQLDKLRIEKGGRIYEE